MINKYTNNYFVFIFESIIAINILDIHSKYIRRRIKIADAEY